ncbi:MAG: hypothetical protein IJT43_07610 [Stomatobaculum sp.]|nr:hypothetical protein [Stomatobaculum sp.]
MTFFDRLQKRFGRFAIPGLMRYFSILYAAGFVISIGNRAAFELLYLNPALILRGQVWRLVTWLIYPPSSSMIFGLLMLLIYYSLGTTLENVWGTFRFNVFMFSGVLFHILAAFILWRLGMPTLITPENLNLSILLAFALSFPEMTFYLYFVIPLKAKYLAIFYGVMEAYAFITGGIAEKITIGVCLLNLLLFFAWSGTLRRFSPKEVKRRAEYRKAAEGGRNSAEERKIVPVGRQESGVKNARHRCAVCGRTELDAPELEFRYCSKCAGDYEYCTEHLYTHTHVTEENTEEDN